MAKKNRSIALSKSVMASAIAAAASSSKPPVSAGAGPVEPTAATLPNGAPSSKMKDMLQSLMAKSQKMDTLLKSTYWRMIGHNGLTLSDSSSSTASPATSKNGSGATKPTADSAIKYTCEALMDQLSVEKCRKSLLRSGYSRSQLKFVDRLLLERVQVTLAALRKYGWPAYFILLFDEIWIMAHMIQESVIKKAYLSDSHNNNFSDSKNTSSQKVAQSPLVFSMDVGGYFVEPKHGSNNGLEPHRKRSPKNIRTSFFPDGMPKHVTCWLPVQSASTPHNGCLYSLTKCNDRGYMDGDTDPLRPLSSAFGQDYAAVSKICALPVDEGSCLLLSHRLIHWGGPVEDEGDALPLGHDAIAFSFSDPAFEKPFLKNADGLQLGFAPPLDQRLCLAAGQAIANHRRLKLDADIMALCHGIVIKFADAYFEEAYKQRVLGEYQWFERSLRTPIPPSFPRSTPSPTKSAPSPTKSTASEERGFINKLFSAMEKVNKVAPETSPEKTDNGLGIFRDIFKSSSSVPAPVSPTPAVSVAANELPLPAPLAKLKEKPLATPVPPSSKDKKVEKKSDLPIALPAVKEPKKKNELTMFKDELMAFDINGLMSNKSLAELLEHRRILEQELDHVPSVMCSTREERAKHLYSIFFNEDGTQKITGADLKNVVPIVCPDYSAVQRMAQGFYGNAKEFDNQGKMFGSIALDLIQNVPLFDRIPDDYGVIQASAKRVGVRIKDNHLRSIGQAFNIFLREACYTYLLFFRTIIPTIVSHCSSNPSHKESFDLTMHSRRIQQDFQTTLCILVSLLPLGELYAEPIVEVVDALLEAAREMSSPLLLSDACHLLSICVPPKEKWKLWRPKLESNLRDYEKEDLHSTTQQLLRKTVSTCDQAMIDAKKKLPKSFDLEWRTKMDSLSVPKAWEITRVLLSSLSDSTVMYKSNHICRLEINDVSTLIKVTKMIHERSLCIRDRAELFSRLCYNLSYRLHDFEPECTVKIMKQMGTKNRNKATKRNLFVRLLLRECQQEFFKPSPGKQNNPANVTDPDMQRDIATYNKRRIRNVRLALWLVKLQIFSPAIVLTVMLPHLLRDPMNTSDCDVQCAILCLRMTGRALDKGYSSHVDSFMKKLKACFSSPTLPEHLKEDISYLGMKRIHNWRDTDSFSDDY